MRPTLIALAAISALLAASQAASAQQSQGSAPYCAQMKGEGGTAAKLNCAFRTMEQCNESVKDEGGSCIRNPAL